MIYSDSMVSGVIVTFRIMPVGLEVNLDSLEETIKRKIKPQKIKRIPIAFGLSAIEIIKLVEEKEGEMDRITNEIMKINGVKGVEVVSLTRSL